MKYISTRGGAKPQNFSAILLEGLSSDGGLAMPEVMPKVSAAELRAWRSLSYAELGFEVIRKFVSDLPEEALRDLCLRTWTPVVYCNVREGDDPHDITPLRHLGDERGAPLSLLGLSNGPTLAFKDMAMQWLGNVFEYILSQGGESLNILGATSGDTGSAAEYAMRGKRGIRVFMLSPYGRMSAFQTAQMFSLQDPNIFNLAVDGVFDDCQDLVKAVSNDAAFKSQYRIGTVNSINWARIVAQVVYYFKGYFAATTHEEQTVSFAVPSGNFGNICAGHIARRMGLPIHKLVCATNENDVLDEFFRTGRYRVRAARETLHTSSPSMDISKASNFERFVFDLVGGDSERLKKLWEQVEKAGGFTLAGTAEFVAVRERFGFVSGRSTHTDRLATISDVAKNYGVVIDTHTADGVKAAREHLDPGVPMIVLETALPTKFAETIRIALGRDPDRPPGFEHLEDMPQRYERLLPDVAVIKEFIVRHAD